MSHFTDSILYNQFDAKTEFLKLKNFFEKEIKVEIAYYTELITILDYLNDKFLKMKMAANYSSIKEIYSEIINNNNYLDAYIYLIEFLKSLLLQIEKSHQSFNLSFTNARHQIMRIIDYDMDLINYQFVEVNNEKLGLLVYAMPKNLQLEEAVKNSNDDVSIHLIEYTRMNMNGNIEGKKAILTYLANKIGDMLKEKRFKDFDGQLLSDIGYMLNNFDIRHNKDEKNYNEVFPLIEENLEEWYDKTFINILNLINLNEKLSIHNDIKQLKDYVEKNKGE